MLHALVTDRKNKAESTNSATLVEQNQQNQTVNWSGRSTHTHDPSDSTTIQQAYGNQARLRMLQTEKGRSSSMNPTQGSVLQQKCACGNAAGATGTCAECQQKQGLLLQTKLRISEPGDEYEQEADRVAEQVIAASPYPGVSGAPPRIQRYAGQTTGLADITAPASVNRVLASSGRLLNPVLKQDMEQRFGHDFSQVQVHSGTAAEQSAREVNAHAYTAGHNIVFGTDRFAPGTHEGRRLIAHELTHVVQQSSTDGLNVGQSNEKGLSSVSVRTGVGALLREPTDAPTLSSAIASDHAASHEETSVTSPPIDPLVIDGSVGVGGKNRADDVAKVQARLLAVGILSETDFAAESQTSLTATPTSVNNGGDALGAAIIDPTLPSSETVNTPADNLGTVTPASSPSAETSPPLTAVTVADSATPTIIPELSLTATIAAIREFQRVLFSKEIVDGNIGSAGRTWRALLTADAASVAKMKEAWERKKQELTEERARKLEVDTARKKLEASEQSVKSEQQRMALASNTLARYVTYIPYTFTYIKLDESGLSSELARYAKTDGKVALLVFDDLYASDLDDVAYKMAHDASDKDLATFDHKVLERMKSAMTGGWQSSEETEQIARINRVGVQPNFPEDPVHPIRSAMLEDKSGELKSPTIDAKTLSERIKQIHFYYDDSFVTRATTGDCLKATKAALDKMGWEVGGSDTNFIPGTIGDVGLTEEQSKVLLAALLAEVQAGNPVVIGIDYQAGSPNVDKVTDHWLYIVASTIDDAGQPVLVAYENADLSSSKISDGNIVFFYIDEIGRLYHDAYFPRSLKNFSAKSHVVVNFRPTRRIPKPEVQK